MDNAHIKDMAEIMIENLTSFQKSNSLADALMTRFQQGGSQRIDLDVAISLYRHTLKLTLFLPLGSFRSDSLNKLASALRTRFQQGGRRVDIDEAISLHRQALDLRFPPHPLRSESLNNLANALFTRFQQQAGQRVDLDEAISLHQQALELRLPPHPLRSLSLNNLASALRTRFQEGGQRIDLDEAISLHRQALKLFLPPHPERSASLNNLANALWTRFQQGGQRIDLDEAISLHRQALELRLPPHPLRSSSLNNLSSALMIRFQQGGQNTDLDEAISLYRHTLELFLPPHPNRSCSLSNLAIALWTRFQQGGQRTDLDEAISFSRQALKDFPPSHPYRPAMLGNLSSALMSRFQQEGHLTDLDEVISLGRLALKLLLPPHPNRSGLLNNLSFALMTRFQKRSQTIDLDEAISLCRKALELRPSPHPEQSISLHLLGDLLVLAYSLAGKDSTFLEQGMSSFFAATQCLSQPASRRLEVAKTWIRHADKHGHLSAIDAYEAALQALPQVVALSFDIQSRHKALINGSDGLARNASICAIRAGHLDKAIEFLEAGRSIFWSQFLSLRSPFDQLHSIEPELADKLRDIATSLELGSHRDTSVEILDNQKKLSLDQEASRLNRLNEEWAKGINEVRKLKGFEDFLRVPRLSSLQFAASKRPIVILVANENDSHCLIMTSTSVHHIPLLSLKNAVLRQLVYLVQIAVSQLPILRSSVEEIRGDMIELLGEERGMRFKHGDLGSSDDVFKLVLRWLWDEVVKPVIDFLDIKKSDEMPVLQWCPTGLFTFLPIHAAGCYDDELAIECAFDYFISSYTPTIGVLLTRTPQADPSTARFKMMVVIQSIELFYTKKELENIQQHVSSDALVEFGVPGATANVESIASRLSDASIVHFACHGKQDRLRPLDSGLKLDDGILRVSRIMKEKMPNGSLAFLCACETAMGDQKLPDEAMSLGASLLFSGFRRVVATMWQMKDEDGPTIADTFYEELFRGPCGKPVLEPDTTKSAQALHNAVERLRSQNVSFRRWVPFIHMGN